MKIITTKYAVVGVVEAILLIALFAIILSTIQLIYVPQLMENREAEHMDTVANQISQLKFAVDLYAITENNASFISIPLTLGSRELPYLITARALGTVSVLDNTTTIVVNSSSQNSTFKLGSIRYEADNAYYEKQWYIFENGAIIVTQQTTQSMRVPPSLSSHLTGSNLDISLTVVNITPYAGRTSASGCDNTYIRVNYSSSSSYNFIDVSRFRIVTDYPYAWFTFLNETLNKNAVTVVRQPNYVEVIPKAGYVVDISMNVIKIYAQTGLGWIGQM